MRRRAFLLLLLFSFPAGAASREKIAAINIAGTSLFTYLTCVVQKKSRPRTCLAAGTLAGAGFYEAKLLAGNGDITTGWLVATFRALSSRTPPPVRIRSAASATRSALSGFA